VTPETRRIEPPIRLTPRRLLIGAAVCLGAGAVVAAFGFTSAILSVPEHPTKPAVAEPLTSTELPTYSLPLERELRPRLP
jgi:hypothetical protein